TVTAQSSNQDLVSDWDIKIGGEGEKRFATISPRPGQFGEAIITLVARDANEGVGIGSFLFVVPKPNAPPVIGPIPDQKTLINTETDKVEFTISDDNTPADQLVLRASSSNPILVTDANVQFGW